MADIQQDQKDGHAAVPSAAGTQNRQVTTRRPKQPDLEMIAVNRKMKTYRVTAQELKNIANDNTVAKGALSTGCALVTFGLGIWSGILIESTPSEIAVKLAWIVVPMCAVLAAVCFVIWGVTKNKRQIELDGILIPVEDQDI